MTNTVYEKSFYAEMKTYVATGGAGENLGDEERLGHETLQLACASDNQLVLFGKLVHSKNSDDILERLVVLKGLLDFTGGVVMLLADDGGVHHAGSGIERIDSGVDTQLGDGTGKHGGGVQMRESSGGGGIGKIIGGDVNGLDGCNGSLLGGGNTLLHRSHIGSERGLVTDSGRDTTEKGGHLGTGLGEAENVVDKQKHILALLITEVLGHGETGQSDLGQTRRNILF